MKMELSAKTVAQTVTHATHKINAKNAKKDSHGIQVSKYVRLVMPRDAQTANINLNLTIQYVLLVSMAKSHLMMASIAFTIVRMVPSTACLKKNASLVKIIVCCALTAIVVTLAKKDSNLKTENVSLNAHQLKNGMQHPNHAKTWFNPLSHWNQMRTL